jgi:hypothetical protein
VARCNEFRRLLRLRPAANFEEPTFAFGDTEFRIFVLRPTRAPRAPPVRRDRGVLRYDAPVASADRLHPSETRAIVGGGILSSFAIEEGSWSPSGVDGSRRNSCDVGGNRG